MPLLARLCLGNFEYVSFHSRFAIQNQENLFPGFLQLKSSLSLHSVQPTAARGVCSWFNEQFIESLASGTDMAHSCSRAMRSLRNIHGYINDYTY